MRGTAKVSTMAGITPTEPFAAGAEDEPPGRLARRLIRSADRAALSTRLVGADGHPYGSLVLMACGQDAAPVLLLSALAEHSRNLDADGRLSLLIDGTAGHEDPLSGARLTVLGRAERTDDPAARARFLARHPAAERYAGFTDFAVWRVVPERAHLVAGFGRIEWIAAADLMDRPEPGLAEAEAGIVEHMNEDHGDALGLYARRLLGLPGEGWRMTGIDPEGCDLRLGGDAARLEFERRVSGPREAREMLVALARKARAAASG